MAARWTLGCRIILLVGAFQPPIPPRAPRPAQVADKTILEPRVRAGGREHRNQGRIGFPHLFEPGHSQGRRLRALERRRSFGGQSAGKVRLDLLGNVGGFD